MYKILVADDEGIVREALQFILEKDFGEQFKLHFARSGRQAIEIAEEQQPDIIILDIQMPGINGLEALREIRMRYPKVKAVMLTAYDHFEYVKEAMEFGASDYLMKPLDRKKIDSTITKLLHELEQEKERRQEALNIREKMEAVVPIIQNGFIQCLMVRDEYMIYGRRYRELLEIPEEYAYMIAFEWGESIEHGSTANPIGAGVMAHKFYGKMAEMIKSYFHACLSDIMGNKVIAAVACSKKEMDYTERITLIERLRALVTALREMTGLSFKAGVGSVRPWEDMFPSYQEALRALRFGVRHVSHIDDLCSGEESGRRLEFSQRSLLEGIKHGTEVELLRSIENYFSFLEEREKADFYRMKLQLLNALFTCRETLTEQGLKAKEDSGMNLLQADDMGEMTRQFREEMLAFFRELRHGDSLGNTTVGKAVDFIKKNFTRELSLEMVAEKVSVSPYYFSKLFKEEMGVNFSEYLTELRISRAKQLLDENPERNIKEVSIESGYANPNYFSRIFKKWTGYTPTEQREQNRH